jgi:hypothetical protein
MAMFSVFHDIPVTEVRHEIHWYGTEFPVRAYCESCAPEDATLFIETRSMSYGLTDDGRCDRCSVRIMDTGREYETRGIASVEYVACKIF